MLELIPYLTKVDDHLGSVIHILDVRYGDMEELDVFLRCDVFELVFFHQPVTSEESMY